jgi:hypothetical protein
MKKKINKGKLWKKRDRLKRNQHPTLDARPNRNAVLRRDKK